MHHVLLAAPGDTTGLRAWLNDNVVQLLILLIGVVMLFASLKAQASKVVMIGGLTLVALLFLGLGASDSSRQQVSHWLMGLVGFG
jgi:membrane-bound ClpP family serine protease